MPFTLKGMLMEISFTELLSQLIMAWLVEMSLFGCPLTILVMKLQAFRILLFVWLTVLMVMSPFGMIILKFTVKLFLKLRNPFIPLTLYLSDFLAPLFACEVSLWKIL
jgi:hypothetical protein